MMGDDIEVLSRDESLDYLKILRTLMELPFSVGKILLADVLTGNYKNKSIITNRLDELSCFGSLTWDKDKVLSELDILIAHGFVEWIPSDYNKFIKVLRITIRGQNELAHPSMPSKKLKNHVDYHEASITPHDRDEFVRLDSFLQGYNDAQKKAIISQAPRVLCVAGAGSGKTTVLTKRIEYLCKMSNVDQEKVLAITFTRKAKQEMEKRLSALGITRVKVHTFNSFCEGILRRFEQEIYGRPMRVLGYADKMFALNLALAHIGLDMASAIDKYYTPQQKKFKTAYQLANGFMNDCFSVMEYFKVTNTPEYDFSKDASLGDRENARMLYEINRFLTSHMQLQGLRDYSDQLLDALTFLRSNPSAIPFYKHILVDEYQDVNASQIELLRLLHAPQLFFVGDPRQSIFGWRGSDVKFILNVEKEYPDVEVIHLTKNYRSSKVIVDFMNHAIKEMGLPFLKHHKITDDSKVSLLEFENEHQEREFVMKNILESSIPREEIFVLARTNRQLLELSQLLRAANIAHILKTDEVRNPVDSSPGEVVLATIHAIKGLEAKKVFLIGATEQNFPCKAGEHPALEMLKTDSYNKSEEERRLFYVAISRAKEHLIISYTSKKPTYFITDDMMKLVT